MTEPDHFEADEFVRNQAAAWAEIKELFSWSQNTTRPETANGPGCTLESTKALRAWLPGLFQRYDITSMLDVACGDWNWMKEVDLTGICYTGWDVEHSMIHDNRVRFPKQRFECVNLLTVNEIPTVSVVLARQILIHFPNDYICQVLDKLKASGSTYLLTSHFPGVSNDFTYDPNEGAWLGYLERPVDLEAPPFSLGPKLDFITEPPGPFGVLKGGHELALFRL